MIPQMMQPLAAWALEAWALGNGLRPDDDMEIQWVPPHRMLVDPAREIVALRDEVRAGFASRQGQIRRLGYDPEDILAEQIVDRAQSETYHLRFDSDIHFGSVAGVVNAPAATKQPDTGGTGKDPADPD